MDKREIVCSVMLDIKKACEKHKEELSSESNTKRLAARIHTEGMREGTFPFLRKKQGHKYDIVGTHCSALGNKHAVMFLRSTYESRKNRLCDIHRPFISMDEFPDFRCLIETCLRVPIKPDETFISPILFSRVSHGINMFFELPESFVSTLHSDYKLEGLVKQTRVFPVNPESLKHVPDLLDDLDASLVKHKAEYGPCHFTEDMEYMSKKDKNRINKYSYLSKTRSSTLREKNNPNLKYFDERLFNRKVHNMMFSLIGSDFRVKMKEEDIRSFYSMCEATLVSLYGFVSDTPSGNLQQMLKSYSLRGETEKPIYLYSKNERVALHLLSTMICSFPRFLDSDIIPTKDPANSRRLNLLVHLLYSRPTNTLFGMLKVHLQRAVLSSSIKTFSSTQGSLKDAVKLVNVEMRKEHVFFISDCCLKEFVVRSVVELTMALEFSSSLKSERGILEFIPMTREPQRKALIRRGKHIKGNRYVSDAPSVLFYRGALFAVYSIYLIAAVSISALTVNIIFEGLYEGRRTLYEIEEGRSRFNESELGVFRMVIACGLFSCFVMTTRFVDMATGDKLSRFIEECINGSRIEKMNRSLLLHGIHIFVGKGESSLANQLEAFRVLGMNYIEFFKPFLLDHSNVIGNLSNGERILLPTSACFDQLERDGIEEYLEKRIFLKQVEEESDISSDNSSFGFQEDEVSRFRRTSSKGFTLEISSPGPSCDADSPFRSLGDGRKRGEVFSMAKDIYGPSEKNVRFRDDARALTFKEERTLTFKEESDDAEDDFQLDINKHQEKITKELFKCDLSKSDSFIDRKNKRTGEGLYALEDIEIDKSDSRETCSFHDQYAGTSRRVHEDVEIEMSSLGIKDLMTKVDID